MTRTVRPASNRNARIAALAIAGLALAPAAAHADGEIVWMWSDGSSTRVRIDGDWKGNQYVDCRPGTCNPCGICHQSTTKGKDQAKHYDVYFPPKLVQLRAGESIAWGTDAKLNFDGSTICVVGARFKRCYASSGTFVLKDPRGTPSWVFSTRPPLR